MKKIKNIENKNNSTYNKLFKGLVKKVLDNNEILFTFYPQEKFSKNEYKAFPLNTNNINIPLEGEIINIYSSPDLLEFDNLYNINNKFYYGEVISIFNNINNNKIEDISKIDEPEYNYNIIGFEGEKIISGRDGNFIKYGFNHSKSKYYNKGLSNNFPYIWISNSQKYYKNKEKPLEPELNQTSTILLNTGLNINYNLSSTLVPQFEKQENEILLYSENIILNTEKGDIINSSKNNIGLYSEKTGEFKSKEELNFDSKEINIGIKENTEASLKGETTLKLIFEIISLLSNVAQTLSSQITPSAGVPDPTIKGVVTQINKKLGEISSKYDINKLLSKKLFIE